MAARGVAGAKRHWALTAVAAVGIALVVMPLAFGMFTKAPKGAAMIAEFKPFMTAARLDGYQRDLKLINAGVDQTAAGVAARLEGPSGNRSTFVSTYPTFASFEQQWPSIDATMTHLMNQVRANLTNYQAVAALPSFRLFPWFFVIPGVLLAAVALAALGRPAFWPRGRIALIILGIGLVAAPAVFQMFGRAPMGGRMMRAFTTIETTSNVQQIQGFFGSMAEGQGAIRLEIVPALAKAGLSPEQIEADFPAVSTLDAQWVGILNDMTPMIGAMSDNVANYQAVASLPPFPLFPWFFVAPGLLVAGLAVAAGRRPFEDLPRPAFLSAPSVPTTPTPTPEHAGVS
jgi:hypothetical protein